MSSDSPETDALTHLLDPARIAPLMVTEYRLWFVNGPHFFLQNPFLLPADANMPYWQFSNAEMTSTHVFRHLTGEHTIGLPALNPESSCCKWFALDADYPGAEEHLKELAQEMKEDGLHSAMESSRRGGHLWVLCGEPIPARLARIYLYWLIDRLGFAIRGARGNADGIEINPKQESVDSTQVGNGLRGPLGVHRKVMTRYWFTDAAPEIDAQFAYLRRLPRCSRLQIEALTQDMDMPEDLVKAPEVDYLASASTDRAVFDIRLFTDAPPRLNHSSGNKFDYFVQCPSCAASGKDNGHDNLHVTVEAGRQAPLYHCFAGCTARDIYTAATNRRAGDYSGRRRME